jgi:long-chain acyl-CoA synthetase
MYLALAKYPGIKPTDCACFIACISGAAPLSAEVRATFECAAGGHVVEGYGLTEASPVTHTNPLGRPKLGTIGVALPDTDAAIVDRETGVRLPPGRVGEVVVRGVRLAEPCSHLAQLATIPRLREALVHRGGLRTDVLVGGRIRVGDAITPA